MSLTSFFARHPRADLSAYIDEQLPEHRRVAMETHLARCTTCSAEVAGLRATRDAIATLPEVSAPRSFALTPQRLAQPARPAPRYTEPVAPAFFGMRIASAGIAVALALVFVADLGTGSDESAKRTGDDSLTAEIAAPSAEDADNTLAAGTDSFSSVASPMVTKIDESDPPAPEIGDGVGGVGSAPDAAGGETPFDSRIESTNGDLGLDNVLPTETPEGYVQDRDLQTNPFEMANSDSGVADNGLTGDNNDGLSALQIAEIILAVTLLVAVTGGFLLPLALRRNR